MADPRFFKVAGPFSLAELARIAEAEIAAGDPDLVITDVAPLATAGPGHISFLDNAAYVDSFKTSQASACIVARKLAAPAPKGMALLAGDNPYRAYALVARAFYPAPAAATATAPSATVDPSARLGEGVAIGAAAVVGANAEIGARSVIEPGAVIGPGVVIGEDCRIGAVASVHYTVMGNRVRIYAGARIGEAGFGYASDRHGHLHIPQLGRVLIGDDVEIGANTTIDRGAGPDTVIGEGCIIDNLVQIAHNVRLGKRCIIVAQVGISGSTTIGDNVVIGGQVGLAGHLKVGDGAQIGAKSGVMRDVEPGAVLLGAPAVPIKEHMRQVATLRRLAAKTNKDK